MIIPIESSQVLIPESAAILGVQAFLKMTHLPYNLSERLNAQSMSPTGKRSQQYPKGSHFIFVSFTQGKCP